MTFSERILPIGEWIFAVLGAAICVGAVIEFAPLQAVRLWPAPGIYFLELIVLAILVLISRVMDASPGKMDYGAIPWIAGGALFAFSILAVFSIGLYIFPAAVAYFLAAILGDIRHRGSIRKHLVFSLVAAVCQVGLVGLFLLLN